MAITLDRIIRSKRRTIALIVERDGSIIVRAPLRMPEHAIREFAETHAQWAEKKKAELRAKVPIQTRQYLPGENFLYLGQEYSLEVVQQQKPALVLDQRFKLAEPTRDNGEMIFQNWYRQQARSIIAERVKFFADRFQFHYENLKITSARTRWGSCSAKGTLSFSWRLIMAPPEVVDYVVVHELVHTVYHNHSKRFWQKVETIMPAYKQHRRWLREVGSNLLL